MNNYDDEKTKLIKELREEIKNYRKGRSILYTIGKIVAIIVVGLSIFLILGGEILLHR